MKKSLKEKAIILRRQGYSFREISIKLNISKSTASLWSREEALDDKARARIRGLGIMGRQNAKCTNYAKRQKIYSEIDASCSVLTNTRYSVNEYKIFLALLYWGEGEKSGRKFSFANSDPEMIQLYCYLLRGAYDISDELFRPWLHLHNYHNREEMIDFWSKVSGIPKNQFSVYNKPHTGICKKPGYKGCLSIVYSNSKILKELFIIIKRLGNLTNAGLV